MISLGFLGETDEAMTLSPYKRFILIQLELKSLRSEMARKKILSGNGLSDKPNYDHTIWI